MRVWSEILSDALSRLGGGKNWIRRTLTNTSSDLPFKKRITDSDKFCAYGAIYKSMVEHGELNENPFIVVGRNHPIPVTVERLLRNNTSSSVVVQNDDAPDFTKVKNMFCRGIKRALDEESKLNATDNASTKDSSDETNNR